MPRILVTGAGGFLGACVVRQLAARGDELIALGRSAALRETFGDARITVWTCDLLDLTALAALDPNGPVDGIVHCAGLSSNWGPRAAFARNNIEATANLLAQARAWNARHFVYVSSSSVYFRFRDQLAVREDSALPRPVNAYAWSKAEAETLVRAASDVPATIVRPRGIYGRGDTALLPRLLRAAARGPVPRFGGGRAVIDLTYVEDVAAAIGCILDRRNAAIGATYNVSGGEALAIHDIMSRSAALAGVALRWRDTSWPLALTAIRAIEAFHKLFRPGVEPLVTAYSAGLLAFSQTLDLSAIRRDIGWRPQISFDEGLRRTFEEREAA
jgi:nucleoside-diphosphate-sugar epimerase